MIRFAVDFGSVKIGPAALDAESHLQAWARGVRASPPPSPLEPVA